MKIPKEDLIGILSQFNPWWRKEKIPDLPSWKRAAYNEIKNLAWGDGYIAHFDSIILRVSTDNEISKFLNFKEGITLAYLMLYNNEWDEKIQNYSVELLYAIRKNYPKEWDSSWKFDAFLGNACNITLRYAERYEAYKRASKKVKPIPPSLLVLLARCYISPGIPPVSLEARIEQFAKMKF